MWNFGLEECHGAMADACDNKEPVYLNIYDLNKKINRFASKLGLGLYHSGVQVHGKEYTFRRQAYFLLKHFVEISTHYEVAKV